MRGVVAAILMSLVMVTALAVWAQGGDEGRTRGPDVLLLRTGSRYVGTLESFDGADFKFRSEGNTLTAARHRVKSIWLEVENPETVGQQPGPGPGTPPDEPPAPEGGKILYIPSGDDPLADDEVRGALSAVGYDVQVASAVPTPLEGWAAVVLESQAAAKPELAAPLRAYIARGGGLVLTRKGAWGLMGRYAATSWPVRTDELSEWVGTSEFGGEDPNQSSWRDPSIETLLPNPFGLHPGWAARERLWQHTGYIWVANTRSERLAQGTVAVAKVAQKDGWAVFAYAHTFGQGRAYFQGLPYSVNYPKLLELFVSGVQWAAGDIRDVAP